MAKKKKTEGEEGEKSTAVAEVKQSERSPSSVEGLISQAISQKLPVEQMERLLALREKVKAEEAREEFVEALSRFQGEMPVIEKTKSVLNKDGRTVRYKFAPIDAIAEQIRTPLANNGLSYRWEIENKEGLISATCIVTHRLGHSEKSSFEVPIDKEGFMTAPQKYASAMTYAKRYSLTNALGISTGDEDTDATDVNDEKAPASDKSKIVFLLRTLKEDVSSKETITEAVKRLSQLDLEEKNYGEIVGRLELLVSERNQDDSSQV